MHSQKKKTSADVKTAKKHQFTTINKVTNNAKRRRSLMGGTEAASHTCGCFLHIDLLAKLWLQERQLSRVYLERQMNRSHVATEMGGICI